MKLLKAGAFGEENVKPSTIAMTVLVTLISLVNFCLNYFLLLSILCGLCPTPTKFDFRLIYFYFNDLHGSQ